MYIHLGEDTVVKQENIVGIFDLDNTSISKHTRFFLRKAEETGKVVNVSYELPRSLWYAVKMELPKFTFPKSVQQPCG